VSAKQNLSRPRPSGLLFLCLLFGLVLFFLPASTHADSLEDSARALARKTAVLLRGASVNCQIRNLSPLQTAEFASLSAAFQDELQKHGVRIVSGDAAATLVLTVTEDPTEYVGVVQIQRKENTETLIESLGLVRGLAAPEPVFKFTLHKEPLFSQDSPMVDVVLDDDGQHAYALGVRQITDYEWRGDHWVPVRAEPIPAQKSSPRELRGSLFLESDLSETAYLPEEECRASNSDAKGWSCQKSTEQIPVRSVSPAMLAGKKIGPWFSAAQFESEGKSRIVIAGQDGLARLYEEGAEPVAVFSTWGSEIASVSSGCGSDWQLLSTGKGDWTQADQVQAFEFRGRSAQPVTAPLEFPGAVIALRAPSAKSLDNAAANASALAIDRDLQTGRYEAYRLTLTCSN
jgi:hypothetical protein